jgi:peptidoglycan/xylan/chitin deacetylase (PgdA/CDA1 family)
MCFKRTVAFILSLFIICAPFSLFCFAEETVPESETIYLPIVMYHEVKNSKSGKDVILPWEFENDLKYLTENNYTTITISDLTDYVYNDLPLPENPIILSFDDGYLNNYVYVLPLLKKYRMKIVFSIIGKNTDDFTNIPDNNVDYSHVTWDQLNEMLATGFVEVQNHSYNLHKYTKNRVGCMQKRNESDSDYEKLLCEDVLRLQNKITSMTGHTPTAFSYPYGRFCDNTDILLKKMGFKATLTCDYGVNKITQNPDCLFGLKRICRSHNDNFGKLLKDANKTIRRSSV